MVHVSAECIKRPIATSLLKVAIALSACRDREEERDHADRLRARAGARSWEVAEGSDLRRLHHPLSADHDDDDGGPRGCGDARPR
jgi:hypothetical protein